MKTGKKNNALEGIKTEQLKRRIFTLEFKAEVVRHKKGENLSWADGGRKFESCPSWCSNGRSNTKRASWRK